MKYIITIKTDNAAFEDSSAAEIEWILQRLAAKLRNEVTPPEFLPLRDSNGNIVGEATYQPPKWSAIP